ncbi:6-phosphofructo-2-kinase, partial [Coemansia erecta]
MLALGHSDARTDSDHKLVVVMVGLPARGKSYIVKKLKRYLSWLGFQTKIFNVGDRRRLAGSIDDYEESADNTRDVQRKRNTGIGDSTAGIGECSDCNSKSDTEKDEYTADQQPSDSCNKCATHHSSTFFDPNNKKAKQIREQVAMDVFEDLLRWLQAGGQIAIHDATNSTIERRNTLINRLKTESD